MKNYTVRKSDALRTFTNDLDCYKAVCDFLTRQQLEHEFFQDAVEHTLKTVFGQSKNISLYAFLYTFHEINDEYNPILYKD